MAFLVSWFLVFSLIFPSAHAKKTGQKNPQKQAQTLCINWPKVFAQEAMRRIPPTAEIVSVTPFYNDTEQSADQWISEGLADLMMRYLAVDPNLGVLPEKQTPRLVPEKPVRYIVGGLFQHIQDWLRIFVQLKDGKGNLLAQFPVETPYPLHQQFFSGLKLASVGIFEKLGHKKINTKQLSIIENETGSVQSFENVIKGKMALESYDPNKIEVALVWFQEARREDPHYPMAYLGLMETQGFLSLHKKQLELPFGNHLQILESTLKEMESVTRKKPSAPNRYLEAHVHYVTGTRALAKENFEKAAAELEQAARLVSEDALASYYLGQAYDKMGRADLAGQFRNHAEEINPCLKGK
ncbi:MAG: hypothetical protein A2W61_05375 [Deltaproteobacteria bacterium RIFCSPLOWO2_01_44_7]|nr:MAG: hypothetical protein A2712_10865 [Deltaproteobacteria bacterium RIFCSPHIGHO2_01_FULL_43_49]OGQ16555.1 MAG: hypothetical protein A3D22_06565 [Deltaproteobacteria bacterium RIFCSPHIGHO2_02_FULL_44_53]OGQ28371.1 MAG: hypothetical protein A3D98_06270 [Deltaproteobacteria bacterium RIFCSPHIGHO2_12_FULL_44_21]OGQ32443.1 MAG: hypothetical protein A2979_10830 [Deltaproteobacteria bacterium RIFCSPLOWO2_01_FULL_45_74]OGQ38115.1 MAG: hypothetical protein A2W61_05375 [Deltaproteobacteria bacterium 